MPFRRLLRQIFRQQHDNDSELQQTNVENIGQVRSLGHRSLSTPNLGREYYYPATAHHPAGSHRQRQQHHQHAQANQTPPSNFLCGSQNLLCSLLSSGGGDATGYSGGDPASAVCYQHLQRQHSEFLQRARCNDAQAVLSFLSRGRGPVDLVQGGNRRTALCYAAANGNCGLAEELLGLGASVNGVDHEVPLIHASENGHLETVRLLLECGAAVAAKDGRGSTALIKAVEHGHADAARLLLASGAAACVDAMSSEPCFYSLEEQSGMSGAPDCGDLSALMRATHELRADLARLLLETGGARVDLANAMGHTAAHAIALTCRMPAVPVPHLVHHPPLHWAAAAGLLLGRPCRMNPRNRCGETPLDRMVACVPATLELAPFKAQAVTAWCEVVRLFILHGADLGNKVNFNHRETTLDRLLKKLLDLMECSAGSEEFLGLARLLLLLSRLSPRRRQLSSAAAYLAGHQMGAGGPRLGRFFMRLREELGRPLSLKAAAALRVRAACGDPLVARAQRLPLPPALIRYVLSGVAEA